MKEDRQKADTSENGKNGSPLCFAMRFSLERGEKSSSHEPKLEKPSLHSPEMKELAGPVLLTESREEAAAFAGRGGCVIGLCPEDALRTIDFPEAYVLASLEAGALSEAFIRRTACHFYRVPFTVAETDRLIIRESVAEDWNVVYDLLRACTEGSRSQILAEGFDLHEIDTSEKFVRYVDACYHFLGFGVWTVLLKEKIQDPLAGLGRRARSRSDIFQTCECASPRSVYLGGRLGLPPRQISCYSPPIEVGVSMERQDETGNRPLFHFSLCSYRLIHPSINA